MFCFKNWLFLLLLCIALSACKTSKKDTVSTVSIETVIQTSIANVGIQTNNAAKTYLLVVEEATAGNEFLKFIVLNVSDQKIVLEKKFRPGHVTWFDNTTIELLDMPGMIEATKKSEDYIRYIKIPDHQ